MGGAPQPGTVGPIAGIASLWFIYCVTWIATLYSGGERWVYFPGCVARPWVSTLAI